MIIKLSMGLFNLRVPYNKIVSPINGTEDKTVFREYKSGNKGKIAFSCYETIRYTNLLYSRKQIDQCIVVTNTKEVYSFHFYSK